MKELLLVAAALKFTPSNTAAFPGGIAPPGPFVQGLGKDRSVLIR